MGVRGMRVHQAEATNPIMPCHAIQQAMLYQPVKHAIKCNLIKRLATCGGSLLQFAM